MIEIKYDEKTNKLSLPKNIRQVGRPGEKTKIYVEDYVVTYINQIAGNSQNEQNIAVLLGKVVKQENTSVAFIEGAIHVRDIVAQDENINFTTEIWTSIFADIRNYFQGIEIVGWFLTRPGKSLGITEKITKIHVDNFPGENRMLYMADPVDNDEGFFIYQNGRLVAQEGYYIYYERNENMQNYMVETKKVPGEEPFVRAAGAEKETPESRFRSLQRNKPKKISAAAQLSEEAKHNEKAVSKVSVKPDTTKAARPKPERKSKPQDAAKITPINRAVKEPEVKKSSSGNATMNSMVKRVGNVAAVFVILVVVIMGITLLNGQQDTQDVISNGASNNVVQDSNDPIDVVKQDDDVIPVEVIDGNIESGTGNSETDKAADETNESQEPESVAETEAETQPDTDAVADNTPVDDDIDDLAEGEYEDEVKTVSGEVARTYTVQAGDTLNSISKYFYNTTEYVAKIKELNNIEDVDWIYPGRTLTLP